MRSDRLRPATGRSRFSRAALVISGAALFALAACDSSSDPTAPAPGEPPAATVVFAASAALEPLQTQIDRLLQDTTRRVAQQLDVGQVTFTVVDDPARTIPGWGPGGYTLGPNDIEIVVDGPRTTPVLLDQTIPYLAAHELHHTVRWRLVGPPFTLLEGLAFEGLADHFASDLLGMQPPWSDAFPPGETERYIRVAEPHFDEAFSYGEWFFAQGPTQLPLWMGYTLGYRLVNRYRAANPGRSNRELAALPAEAIRP